MGQKSNDAASKGAQIFQDEEEYVGDTGQNEKLNHLALKDAQIKSLKEDCA